MTSSQKGGGDLEICHLFADSSSFFKKTNKKTVDLLFIFADGGSGESHKIGHFC